MKDSDTSILVSFQNADIQNGESTVLYDVNFNVFAGDFVYIMGRVGSGKTSIIRSIMAENPLVQGHAYACGFQLENIKNKNISKLRRRIGVVFQDFQLLMDRSIYDNLAFVLKATGWRKKDDIDRRISEVLKEIGLETKAHKRPHQLSGGEQQRICVARAILNYPELILADEPTGNLDSDTTTTIMDLLQRINKSGTAIIMVTHNKELADKYKGRMIICKNEGCEEIFTNAG